MLRLGMLTSGGDCPGLNAAIRGICLALYNEFDEKDIEIFGFLDGYRGLIKNEYKILNIKDCSEIIELGGTILGTSRQPFKKMKILENGIDKVEAMKNTYTTLGLDCLVVLGGNGTQKTANLLVGEGLNVISLPKTIDNDIWGTDFTFGFHSAVCSAVNFIDCIKTSAESHSRVFIVELMGHKAGWLALYAGIASGADVVLIPEIPYRLEPILEKIEKNKKIGKKFSIIAVAEGAGMMTPSNGGNSHEEILGDYSVVDMLAYELKKNITQEVKVSYPGHYQRGGGPCAYDRVLSTRFGAAAADLIKKGLFGKMVALKNNSILPIEINDIAGKLKMVPLDCEVLSNAKNIGVSFGA